MMKILVNSYRFYVCLLYVLNHSHGFQYSQRQERALIYPGPSSRSLAGLFIAIALPVDLPNKNIFVSYNFEGNYYLPYNISELNDMAFFTPITDISRQSKSLGRKFTYTILEKQFSRLGFPGRPCLLRIICEASEISLLGNGIVGDIAHIILTPSASKDENLTTSFYIAEKRGKEKACNAYFKKCPSSVLDTISKIV